MNVEERIMKIEKELEDLRFFVNELYNLRRAERDIYELKHPIKD